MVNGDRRSSRHAPPHGSTVRRLDGGALGFHQADVPLGRDARRHGSQHQLPPDDRRRVRGPTATGPRSTATSTATWSAISRAAALLGDSRRRRRLCRARGRPEGARATRAVGPDAGVLLPSVRAPTSREASPPGRSPTRAGRYAGNPHGREEIGFVPWQFDLPDSGYEAAWRFLMDTAYFCSAVRSDHRRAPRPAVPDLAALLCLERQRLALRHHADPGGDGQPARQLPPVGGEQGRLFPPVPDLHASTSARTAAPTSPRPPTPTTGHGTGTTPSITASTTSIRGTSIWSSPGSSACARAPTTRSRCSPLAPATWDYFAVDNIAYHGHQVAVIWDRTGTGTIVAPG